MVELLRCNKRCVCHGIFIAISWYGSSCSSSEQRRGRESVREGEGWSGVREGGGMREGGG